MDGFEIPRDTLESLKTSARTIELAGLLDGFRHGLEVTSDPDRVNELITASDRPELTLASPVPQMSVDFPVDYRRINNFTWHMRSFGPRVYAESEHNTPEPVGRSLPSQEELDFYYFCGARGSVDDYFRFAADNNLDEDTITELLLQTHLSKEAFMRMWIALPDLTGQLMRDCIDDRHVASRPIDEEIFIAYNIMARLVDLNDTYVIRRDGEVDSWFLCR